jgi:hypothetical protein
LIFPDAQRIQKGMATPGSDVPGWERALMGLGFVRRGSVLVAASGLLLLLR